MFSNFGTLGIGIQALLGLGGGGGFRSERPVGFRIWLLGLVWILGFDRFCDLEA